MMMQDSAPLPSEEPKASPSIGESPAAEGAPQAGEQPAGRQADFPQGAARSGGQPATANEEPSRSVEQSQAALPPTGESGPLPEAHEQASVPHSGSTQGDAKKVAEAAAAETVSEARPDAEQPSDEAVGDDEFTESPPVPKGPIEETPVAPPEIPPFQWYIIRVAVNREDSAADALRRRIEIAGMQDYFGEIVVPTEDVVEFTKQGKKRTVKRKLFPGYIMVRMALTDDTWFLVRETPGIGDFTGGAGRPTPMTPDEVRRIIRPKAEEGAEEPSVRIAIPFSVGDRVRVKDGYFQNFEGDVAAIDETNGRVTVMINIFGRSTPVELQHWQMERI